MTTTQVSCTRPQTSGRPRAWHYIGLGSLCGLAWVAGLRGFMAQVAGSGSEVEWAGTFRSGGHRVDRRAQWASALSSACRICWCSRLPVVGSRSSGIW